MQNLFTYDKINIPDPRFPVMIDIILETNLHSIIE